LALIPIAGLMNFYTLPTGTQSRVPLSMLAGLGLVGLWLVQVIFLRKDHERLVASPINMPMLFLVFEMILSFGWSTIMRDPLVVVPNSFIAVQIAALSVNIFLPLTTLFVSNVIKEVRWIKYLAWAIVGSGGLIIVLVYINLPIDSLYNSGYRGLYASWVCSIAFAMVLFNRGMRPWLRVGLAGLVAAWFYNDFFLHNIWFSGWMPIAVSLLVLLLLRNIKLFAGVVLAVGLLAAMNTGWIYDNLYQAKVDNGDAERLGLWQNNIDLVVQHPLFGVGPAGYAVYYMTYHPLDARSTHNNYFDIVAQTGVIGAAIFVWLIVALLWIGLRLQALTRGRRDFEEAFGAAAFAGMFGMLVAMFLGDWVLPFAYNQTITGFDNAVFTWLMLGGMVALYSILKRQLAAGTGSTG
jgi:O-antigen ligase